jgi:hypothetical protein
MAFGDDLHFETHEAIGRVKEAEGNLDEARGAYQRAEQVILDDPKVVPKVSPWSERITKLRARRESLSSGRPTVA